MHKFKRIHACPFCGGYQITLQRQRAWFGMSARILRASIIHRCERSDNESTALIMMEDRSEDLVVQHWNRRCND